MVHRFHALDAFRGLLALSIVVYHMKGYNYFGTIAFVDHSYLFVDFFFVLSGFVLNHNYGDRLVSVAAVKEFVGRRFRRLYPLHLYALLLMGLLELSKMALHRMGIFNTPAFDVNNLQNFTSSLFMLDSTGVGMSGRLAWNFPSWSVSAEFISSLLFAILLFLISRFKQLGSLIVAVPLASLGLLYAEHGNLSIAYTFDFGFARGVFGFFVGVIAYRFVPLLEWRQKRKVAMSLLELFSIASVTILVAYGEEIAPVSVVFPLLCGGVVVLFSLEGGILSTCLKAPFFQMIGKYSYSIYLNNMVVIICADILFIRVLKMPPSLVGLMPLIIILLVVVYSKYTYEYIESRFYKKRSP